MSQADAIAFLEKAKYYAERHVQEIDNALAELRDVDDGTAAAIMAGEAARAMSFHDEELAALQGWAAGAPPVRKLPPVRPRPQVPAAEPSVEETASPAARRNMEERLIAMGAVPTLGGLLKIAPSAAKAQLHATASPAARELLRRRLNCPDGGVIQTVGSGGLAPQEGGSGGSSPMAQPHSPSTPSWQEELRAKRLHATPSRSKPAVPEAAVNDELAALFAKRQALN